METIEHDDGSFTIRVSNKELAEVKDREKWLEVIIEEAGFDPDHALVTFGKSLSKAHTIISVEPDVV